MQTEILLIAYNFILGRKISPLLFHSFFSRGAAVKKDGQPGKSHQADRGSYR